MIEKEKEKTYPFPITEYYSPALNSLKRVYTQHPKFTGNTRLIYELLFDYWNKEYGYAFPTLYELARESGMSIGGVKSQISNLVELGLIKKEKTNHEGRLNDVYYIYPPKFQSVEELIEAFPEDKHKILERIQRIDNEEMRDKERLKNARKRYTVKN